MTASEVLERCAVYVFTWGVEPPSIADIIESAQCAESLGFGSVQTAWHFTKSGEYILDPLVAAPILANETRRVGLSINSIVLPTLHPAFWADYLANLDALSGGRLTAGVAVGAVDSDFQVGEAVRRERGKRFDEALQQFVALLRSRPVPEAGAYYDSRGITIEPAPRRDLRILVGGGAPSIPRAAKWGDILNPIHCTPEEIGSNLRPALDKAASAEDRAVMLAMLQYATVILDTDSDVWQQDYVWSQYRHKVKNDHAPIVGSPTVCAARVSEYFRAGVDQLILEFDWHGAVPAGGHLREQMRRFAEEVAPLVET
jgi:alkanesulfonate monooxygenase SsuD/methylene tetrahydromethanopterin reductase-like flavin-dependent oxidoreductase (luciferase family)